MSEFPSLPLFTDAYLADTRHLTAQEHGAYLLLLMMAWRLPDCRLPDDDARLAKWASVDARTWKRIKPTVMAFWTLAEDHWCQSRLTRERDFVSKRAEVARQNGKLGGRPKPMETHGSDNPMGSARDTQPKAPNPSPNPIVIEPIAQQLMPRVEPMLFDRLFAAAGLDPQRPPHPKLLQIGPILDLVRQNYDLDGDVLPAVRDLAAAGTSFSSWSYVVPIVVERVAKRNAIPPKPQPQAEDWRGRMKVWREDGTWAPAWGPKPDEPRCRVPAEYLSTPTPQGKEAA